MPDSILNVNLQMISDGCPKLMRNHGNDDVLKKAFTLMYFNLEVIQCINLLDLSNTAHPWRKLIFSNVKSNTALRLIESSTSPLAVGSDGQFDRSQIVHVKLIELGDDKLEFNSGPSKGLDSMLSFGRPRTLQSPKKTFFSSVFCQAFFKLQHVDGSCCDA